MSASSKEVALSSINTGPENVPDTNDGSSLHVPLFAVDNIYAKQRAIDSKIEAMQSAMNTLSIQIAQAAKERNVFSPIAKLPTEIIILILVVALESAFTDTVETETPYYRRLQLLAQVSTTWRDLITHTPIFWTVVEIGLKRQSYPLSLALRKAEGSPLSVSYSTKYWQVASDDPYARDRERIEVENALRIVRAQDARWKSLYLRTTSLLAILDFFRNKPPNLERLHVIIYEDFNPTERWPQDVSLLEGYTTRLKEIRLENLPLRWQEKRLAGLRVLDLQRVRSVGYRPTAARVLRILQACPQLEILRLKSCKMLDRAPKATETTINLPQLRIMDLGRIPLVVVAAIMQSVRAPSLHHFSLDITDPISPLKFQSYLTSHIPALRRIILRADLVEISNSFGNVLGVSVRRQEEILFGFKIVFKQGPLSKYLVWLANHLPMSPTIKSRTLRLDCFMAQPVNVEALSRWIPFLTKLDLQAASQPERMLEILSEHTPRDGAPGWLWPGLRELRIMGTGVTGANILRFLRKRYQSSPLQQMQPDSPSAGGGKPESVKEPNTPAMLDILHVLGTRTAIDDETRSQIYDIIGKDAFTWPK
ncbi:hypothetical protein FRC04_008202 [Tulasnella sp. 424]|nr:hypothetical protein FRC04_008202 [Tulasnella sp. 424]KAG8974481.1 hypothetical protein FRC05_007280 [Tulasnella sp. 425]